MIENRQPHFYPYCIVPELGPVIGLPPTKTPPHIYALWKDIKEQ